MKEKEAFFLSNKSAKKKQHSMKNNKAKTSLSTKVFKARALIREQHKKLKKEGGIMKQKYDLKKNIFTRISIGMLIFIFPGLLILQQGCTTPQASPSLVQNQSNESLTAALFPFFSPSSKVIAKQAQSVEEITSLLRKTGSYGNFGINGGISLRELSIAPKTSDTLPMATSEETTPEYSRTNNQVQEVDEADIIKTDGGYIYTITGNTLFIIKAYPGEEAEIKSTIKLKEQPTALFIQDNRLILMGNSYQREHLKAYAIAPQRGMSFLFVYNISNKEEPKKLIEHYIEGRYEEARLLNETVILLTKSWPQPIIRDPLPIIIENGEKRTLAPKDIIYFPYPYDQPMYITLTKMKLAQPEKLITKTIIVEGNTNLYVNKKHLYLTETKYINEWQIRNKIIVNLLLPKLPEEEQQLIEKIKAIDDVILSPQEKEQKILAIIQLWMNYELSEEEQEKYQNLIEKTLDQELEQYGYRTYTMIHKFSLADDFKLIAHTQVPGQIINQFSLDEWQDTLRIATTLDPFWRYSWKEEKPRPTRSNAVFTYDKNLQLLDKKTDIAPDERIYSTRFMGRYLYMITFHQIDPFFVIDLADPKNIKILGKLKIPGFSRYLHPYDNTTIIGIGRDTDERGRTKGLKIGLYDVSDVTNPRELATFVTKERYAQSIAEYEHKAFLFSKEKHLLVIPAYSSSWEEGTWKEHYNGAMVFEVTKTNITLKGIIDHSEGRNNYYRALVERSLYIGDYLYTKSPYLLRINKLPSLAAVKNLELKTEKEAPYPIY